MQPVLGSSDTLPSFPCGDPSRSLPETGEQCLWKIRLEADCRLGLSACLESEQDFLPSYLPSILIV